MSSYSLACSVCHEMVVKSVNEELKIRSKVLLVKDNNTYAVCKGCGSEIPVPLRLDADMAKSLSTRKKEPRLYLKA